ncbi:unnamed protein product [Paramecium sonneborni]|uniref:Uncharacterized protein n=1 Tax=Paramecium sonneborni TaxID=65129 RepID=A0A8S1P8F0_9CILI|nr:unnamed protein product [Paramecium sonneborni]
MNQIQKAQQHPVQLTDEEKRQQQKKYYDTLENTNKTLKEENQKFKSDIQKLQEENKKLSEDLNKLNYVYNENIQKLSNLQQQQQVLATQSYQLKQQEQKLQDNEKEITHLKKKKEEYEKEIQKLQFNQQIWGDLKKEQEKLQQELTNYQKKIQNFNDTNSQIVKLIKQWDFKKNNSQTALVQECQNLLNLKDQVQQKDKNTFKCCKGENIIIGCQQKKCFYHLNCIDQQLIMNEEIKISNCACGDPFSYNILRKSNQVLAKYKLEQILERQVADLLLKYQKEKGYTFYKCPNLFCNFQWLNKSAENSLNIGQISYCLNCQVKVHSEIETE